MEAQRTVAPEEADLMIGRSWFSQSRAPVVVHDVRVKWDALDARARAAGGPERMLFVHGLEVGGAVLLDGAPDSVYVVLGDLHARRLEVGDTTLAVAGRVLADEYVWAPSGTGMFALGGDATSDDATAPVLPPVLAPLLVWFESRRGADQIYMQHDRTLRRLAPDELPGPLAALFDPVRERFTDAHAALQLLRGGQWRGSLETKS
jgi:hypothetical protein